MVMKNMNLNDLAKRAFENAKAKGFHDEKHTDAHWLMLVVCELAEAYERAQSRERLIRKALFNDCKRYLNEDLKPKEE